VKRLLLVLAACSSKDSPPPPRKDPPPPKPQPLLDQASLVAGKVPVGFEMELINVQCRICHNLDYLTQQRLSEDAWKKTIEKMKKFGANLTDAQVATVASFAARHWSPDLPDRTWTLVAPPPGALPD
jgi:hypothetical protein